MSTDKPTLHFTVPGKVIPKGRPRVVRFKNKAGAVAGMRSFTPERTVRYESIVREEARAAMEKHGLVPLQGLVAVRIIAYWEWPTSKFRKTKPREAELAPTAQDFDNVAKSLCDSMNSICYLDDKQVVIGMVEKWRCAQGEPARAEVYITSLDNEWNL